MVLLLMYHMPSTLILLRALLVALCPMKIRTIIQTLLLLLPMSGTVWRRGRNCWFTWVLCGNKVWYSILGTGEYLRQATDFIKFGILSTHKSVSVCVQTCACMCSCTHTHTQDRLGRKCVWAALPWVHGVHFTTTAKRSICQKNPIEEPLWPGFCLNYHLI